MHLNRPFIDQVLDITLELGECYDEQPNLEELIQVLKKLAIGKYPEQLTIVYQDLR